MKTVILLRHSKPEKGIDTPNEQIPLSENGICLAKELFSYPTFDGIRQFWASPYRRTLETAELLGDSIRTDFRLRERDLGDPTSLNAEFWGHQYRDHSYKNHGGESLSEVQLRMTAFMDELIQSMEDGEKSVVVSHAAAICSYLLNFCSITVVNEEKKLRCITFGTQTILNGAIAAPSAFILTFDDQTLIELSYLEC